MGRLKRETIEKILLRVQRPARYTGGELNIIIKNKSAIRIAISYPDLYEIGMSNIGVRILYDIANKIDDVACERVFAVAGDFEDLIRQEDITLYTLETYTPLNELDLIGFNISHELLYTNVIQILDLGGIPIFSRERKNEDPIIIAGGNSVSNPFPLKDFIDAFFIGDGEEGIIDILRILKTSKTESSRRKDVVECISEVDGVLIPSMYKFIYNGIDISEINGKIVRKRIYRDIKPVDPVMPLIPNIRIAQERAVIEVSRGCPNLCKFCHSGYYELPYRSYPYQELKEKALSIIRNTGYNEISLLSLSISDYMYVTNLINRMLPYLTENGISISLPSLRVDKRTIPIIKQVSDLRKTSLTFAVESASDEIRGIANKKVIIKDLLSMIEHFFKEGWRVIKLYFMIGLPGCDKYEEAESIIALLNKIIRLPGKGREINVTISPFVPKPHTPFQRERQLGYEYLRDTISRIKHELPRAVKIKNHDAMSSILEGVLSRGDERLGRVIYRSYMDGCRLDSWKEHFDINKWRANLDQEIPDWEKFLNARNNESILPWSVVETGFESLIKSRGSRIDDLEKSEGSESEYDEVLELSALNEAINRFRAKYPVNQRVRIKFSKKGLARFIPHIDFIEIIKRALRMAGAPVSFTQGYNKRERISVGFPLPIGIESEAEFFDVELYDITDENFEGILSKKLPSGIGVVDVHYIEEKESLMSITCAMDYRVNICDPVFFNNAMDNLDSKISFIKDTKKGGKELAFHDVIHCYEFDEENGIILRLYTGKEGSMRIDKVILSLTGADYDELYKFRLVKIAQYRMLNNGMTEIR